MLYPSIRIEGSIFSPDILDRLDDAVGQRPADFGLESNAKVKDEIARAWADAQDYWRIFQRKLENIKPDSAATTETRNNWIVPLLGLMGYQLEYQARGVELNGKNYPISHRVTNRGNTPVHVVGYREPSGLDRKAEKAVLRMSAHAMLQEYLNLQDELYGLVTNGRVLRLLRDSSRLIKLTYLEFDLDRIFTDGLFADFAVLYRLLHSSRLPSSSSAAAESLIERYHQDSLDSGARIRDGLSNAVEQAIRDFANGFLSHPNNTALKTAVMSGAPKPEIYYQQLLRLIYRLLFLMVIEERDLVFPQNAPVGKRDIYYRYYSLQRLRRMSEKRYLADKRKHDLWLSLQATFRLFEAGGPGNKLGIAALAGDLFHQDAIKALAECTLGNDVILKCLRSLGLYQHPDTKQIIRVNYAALNVEELGSVYEGLLKFDAGFDLINGTPVFTLQAGDDDTQSHYTPDDLVQPLIKHSLDYLIADKLKEPNPQQALLSLRVADISCGSGHILLAAARRIATELAILRSGEDQPSPSALRAAVRDVIHECIYGVDLNPLAVELCKVALWLEAHVPGEPLNFLDHHIKCGNAIVGFVRREEVERGVPEEAFAAMPGDDKETGAVLRKENKKQRAEKKQASLNLSPEIERELEALPKQWDALAHLPERTPAEIEEKKRRFLDHMQSKNAWWLQQIASIPIAQFYLPKTSENKPKIITDADFRAYWTGQRQAHEQAIAAAMEIASRKHFFHWFLEFPDIIERGGFDCILGNPPYLGGQKLSGKYGHPFCHYVKWEFAPAGLSNLVTFFVRRIYALLQDNGFTALITTSSIKDGDVRRDSLEQIIAHNGVINFAFRNIRWPGKANVDVSQVSIHKGQWKGDRNLDGKRVDIINAYLGDSQDAGNPLHLKKNSDKIYQGILFLGEGFLLDHEEAKKLIEIDLSNNEVIFPLVNTNDVNNKPDQTAGRKIINFFDWPMETAMGFEQPFERVQRLVKPVRDLDNRTLYRDRWWLYAEGRRKLTSALQTLERCFVVARSTKYLNFSAFSTDNIFTDVLVYTTERWDFYCVVQSTLHEAWARKYSGSKGQAGLRYSPTDCFEGFAFPEALWQTPNLALEDIGERYHERRRALMHQLWIGLTDLYNLFHERDLTPERVAKVSKKTLEEAQAGYQGVLELRQLHRALDVAVRDAYGWSDLDLGHDFQEVETLPENDRVRYTISPTARKEVLKRLLALNHQLAAAEAAVVEEKTVKRGKKAIRTGDQTASIPAGAWARPLRDQRIETGAMLTAIIKALDGPTPIRQLRLAAIWALEPRLLLPYLDLAEAAAWQQRIGNEAEPLPASTVAFVPAANSAWGDAVRQLRATGLLVENLQANTWALGTGLGNIDTSGWADGRARMVLEVIRRTNIDIDEVVQQLPDNVYYLWEHAEAA